MNVGINIASIPIILKGADFFKRLGPEEFKLIKPFLDNTISRSRTGVYSFEVNPLRCGVSPAGPSMAPELLKKFRVSPIDNRCRIFIEEHLYVFNKFTVPYLGNKSAVVSRGILRSGKGIALLINQYVCAALDERTRKGDFIYNDDIVEAHMLKDGHRLYRLDMLRVLLRMILGSRGDGTLLHASSVEHRGAGYVFVGPSSCGKSTLIRMLSPWRVFSDEVAVIRMMKGSYKIFLNPWWNSAKSFPRAKLGSPVALKAIFFIEKSDKTSLERLGYKDSLARLLYGDRPFQQMSFLDNKAGIRNFYLFSQGLLGRIPAFALGVKKGVHFRKEFSALLKVHGLQ